MWPWWPKKGKPISACDASPPIWRSEETDCYLVLWGGLDVSLNKGQGSMPYWPCLQGFAQLYKDFGQVVNPFSKHTGRPSMIEDENMQHILMLLPPYILTKWVSSQYLSCNCNSLGDFSYSMASHENISKRSQWNATRNSEHCGRPIWQSIRTQMFL